MDQGTQMLPDSLNRGVDEMKIGMNLLLWTDIPQQKHLPLLKKIKDWGFDGVEIPLDDMTMEDAHIYAKELKNLGLEATGIVSMSAAVGDPISPDKTLRDNAVNIMTNCIDKAEVLGIHVIAGPLYQGLGRFTGKGPTEQEKQYCVEYFKKVTPYAASREVLLAGEAINRFETYFVNTVEQACEIIDRVDSPYLGLHVDTFHGNIEELNICDAWRKAGSRIKHVHISENTRGIPGTGNAVKKEIFDTLNEIGYDNWLTIEAFGVDVQSLASRLHIWRPMAQKDEDIPEQGYKYIASMIGR